jgi:hypothetical protein
MIGFRRVTKKYIRSTCPRSSGKARQHSDDARFCVILFS